MLHLVIYNVKVKLRNFGTTFWPLAFPLILGTLFFFAFGNINDADFETVPVAVVNTQIWYFWHSWIRLKMAKTSFWHQRR